jgi:hypothetical protein
MRIFYLLLLPIFLVSCSTYYYAPNSHNVPLFKEKNEVRADIKGTIGDDFNGFEAQAAYSITDNVAVMGNYIMGKGGTSSDLNGRWGRGHLVEGGAGYYKEIVKDLVFESYGGVGFGRVKNHHYEGGYAGSSTHNLFRVFLQPQIGYASNVFDAAFSTRFGLLRFNQSQNSNSAYYTPSVMSQLSYINANPNSIMAEPAITMRLGWKYVKLQLQATASYNLSNSIPMVPLTVSGGVHVSLAPRFKAGK